MVGNAKISQNSKAFSEVHSSSRIRALLEG